MLTAVNLRSDGHFPASRRGGFERLGIDAANMAVATVSALEGFNIVEDVHTWAPSMRIYCLFSDIVYHFIYSWWLGRNLIVATEAATPRFIALDRLRGLAVVAMICAHFGPGIYQRLNLSGALLDVLDLFGRIATPAFVLIFGITLGLVYVPRARLRPDKAKLALLKRAIVVLLCCIAVSAPATVLLLSSEGSELMFNIAQAQYNVLLFYVVALSVTSLLLGWIASWPAVFVLVLGPALVFVGSFLGYDAWPYRMGEPIELLRLLLVSGKYGVLVLLGCAWMMLGVGVHIQKCLATGKPFSRDVLMIAAALILLGLSDGRVVGWRTVGDLASGYGAPPQLWYLAMIGGVTLGSLIILDAYRVPFVSFVLEHIGRHPLQVYAAHAFVLPGAALLRVVFVGIPDALAIGAPLLFFVAFCANVVRVSAGRTKNSASPLPHPNANQAITP